MTTIPNSTPPPTRAALASCGAMLAMLAVSGCGDRTAEGPDVLATVNGQAITAAQFAHQRESQGGGADSAESRRATLDDLVRRSVLAQQARAAGLAEDPEVVAQIENLLVRRLRETQLEPQCAAITVSDDEVTAWYEAHKASRFTVSARDRFAVLWFGTRGLAPLAARYRPRLEAAREAVRNDPAAFPPEAGFGPLAIDCSEHRASRYRGGDIGWIDEGVPGGDELVSIVAEIGRQLAAVGDVSPVTETTDGLVVVRLVDRVAGGVKELAEVRDEIRHSLLAAKRRALEEDFESAALAGADIVRHADRLDGLRIPGEPADHNGTSALAAIATPGAPAPASRD